MKEQDLIPVLKKHKEMVWVDVIKKNPEKMKMKLIQKL
jgi:hypothetical protein